MNTPKEEGYKYIESKDGEHIFLNTFTGIKEVFIANKGHASWGLRWRNTELEFCRS